MSVAGGAGGVALTLMTGSTLNFYDKAYVSSHLSALFPNNKITFAVVDDFVGLDAALRTESQAMSAGSILTSKQKISTNLYASLWFWTKDAT